MESLQTEWTDAEEIAFQKRKVAALENAAWLRFAGAALQGLLAAADSQGSEADFARRAGRYADAMLAEAKKRAR